MPNPAQRTRPQSALSAYRASLSYVSDGTEPGSSAEPNVATRKRIKGIAYSGGVVPDHGWLGNNAIDIAKLETKARVNLLAGHDHAQIVGNAAVTIEGGALIIEGEISDATLAGKELKATLDEGLIQWELSVGINGTLAFFEPRQSVAVNGQLLELDSLFTSSRLLEVSFVASGADPNTHLTQLSAKYGAGQPTPHPIPSGEDPMKLEEALAKVTELQSQLTAVNDANQTLMTELAAIKADARKAEVSALFKAAFNRPPTDAEVATYGTFNAEQFAAVRQTLGAVTAPDPKLLAETATFGSAGSAGSAGSSASPGSPDPHAQTTRTAAAAKDWLASLNAKYGAHSQTA